MKAEDTPCSRGQIPIRRGGLVAFVKANLKPDAMTETQRYASGIRFNAQMKSRLLPQLKTALAVAP